MTRIFIWSDLFEVSRRKFHFLVSAVNAFVTQKQYRIRKGETANHTISMYPRVDATTAHIVRIYSPR